MLSSSHQNSHESALTVWSDGLRQRILDIFPLEIGIEPIAANVLLPPKWTLGIENQHTGDQEIFRNCTKEVLDAAKSQISQSSGSIHIKNGHVQQPQDTGQYLDALLETTHRVTAKHHWQDVRHMTFSTVTQASYQPGDVLTIYPKNDPHDVDKVLSLMRWVDVADERLELIPTQATNSSLECHVASPFGHLQEHGMTLRTLLTSHLDLNAIPRRSFFSLISHFTEDEFQKNRLLEFINPEFIDELYDYTTRPRRSVVEVLQEFDTVKIPWQWATNVFPELRGRQFSITSGGQLKGGEGKNARFELLVAIVKYKTVIKKIREGVCTRYLAGLNPGYSLRVSLHKGGLAITKAEASQPVVLIGPGTGVAPMRSLIWERYLWDNQLNANTDTKDISRQGISSKIGESVLFFGCRSREADYFFQDEWEDLKSKMPLQVFVAFSRDQKQKVYVQDLIRQQSSLVYRLLHEENGIVYICGSSGKMPQAVREALIEVFQTGKGNDREVAEAYLLTMEKQGRYKQETW